ncbi:MAG: nucleotidyltransferase family protein [Spirochaetota bacterium]
MPHASDCDCILLAAGLSSRMQGVKMLREIDGQPLVRIAANNALAGCRRVILVLGHEADAVRRAAGLPPQVPPTPAQVPPTPDQRLPTPDQRRPTPGIEAPGADAAATGRLVPVDNPLFRDGMFGSIQAGMRWVETEWFFVVPGDMPGITPGLYEAVAREAPASEANGDDAPRAVVPYYGSTRGHPVLIHQSLIAGLLVEPRSAGPMRDLIARHSVRRAQIDDPAIALDVDTDSDYRRITDG